jgi:glycine/D-amino acid oxidase-like deaminating enzyme
MRDALDQCGPNEPFPNSLFASEHAGESYPSLKEDTRADVVIIGAGLTGLSTAIALAEHGTKAVVLEANQPGWGASGRNGGQVNPGLKLTPDELEKEFGRERGRRMIDFSFGAVDRVFEIVAKYAIDCDLVRGGGFRAAVNRRHTATVRALVEQCAARGMPVEYYDAARIAEATGTDRYAGAMFDSRHGQLSPLKYARGLAAVAARLGALIHGNSPAIAVDRVDGRWQVSTPDGKVTAERVLFATNGYTDALVPGLARSILPVFSSIVSTEPLPPGLAARILAKRQVLFEIGRVTTYYRVDASRRLVFGGRGVMKDASGVDQFSDLKSYALRLWPELKAIRWEYGWNGRIAMTSDHLPHVHDLGDGRIACLGYNGRGVAVASAIGAQLASVLLGAPLANVDLPVVPVKKITMQPWWRVGAIPVILWNRAADRLGY